MVRRDSRENDEYLISDRLVKFRVHGLCGVMDKNTKKVIIPAMYDDVSMAAENILRCCIGECDCCSVWEYNATEILDQNLK